MRITESQLRRIVRKLITEGAEGDDYAGQKTADAVQRAMDKLEISNTDHFEDFMQRIKDGIIRKDIDEGGLSWWTDISNFIEEVSNARATNGDVLKAVEVASQEMWGSPPPDSFYKAWEAGFDYEAWEEGFEPAEPQNDVETERCDSCGKQFPEDELEDVESSGYGPYYCAQCLADQAASGIPFGVPKNDYEIPEDLLDELIGYVGKNYEISGDAAEVIRWTLGQGTHGLLGPPEEDDVYRGLLLNISELENLGIPNTDLVPGKTYTFKGSFPVRLDREAQSWTDSKSVASWFAGWRKVGKDQIAVIWEASAYDNGDVFLDLNPIYVHFGREAGITKQDEREVLAVPQKPIIAKKIWIKVGK